MFFNIKTTAVFALIYALMSTVGKSVVMANDDDIASHWPMLVHAHTLVPPTFTTECILAMGLVMGLVALIVMLRFTPDYWSYLRAGVTLWLGSTAIVPALAYAFDLAQPSVLLYAAITNTLVTAICLAVMTASFKRRRLSNAIAARLAARAKAATEQTQATERGMLKQAGLNI